MADELNDPSQLLGRELGGCVLEGVLGRGGMGVVYRARHLRLERSVAVKVFSGAWSAVEGMGERLLQEARLAARLEDPRIVQVHDAGKDGDLYYIIMQLVPGETLEQRVMRAGPLDLAAALSVMKEVIAGLQAAHRLGIIHRDIKPGNIMLDLAGGVKIMDFGLSAAVGPSPTAAQEGESGGSWDFMPPEQGFGAVPDPRMDLYAFGATFFYALTGAAPYRGASASDILIMHREAPVPDIRQRRPEVTPKLAGLLSRLMQKAADKRPATAAEVLTALGASDILLNVDLSGSPFVILPAKPLVVEEGFVPPEAAAPEPVEGTFVAPAPEPPPPPPPPAPKAPPWTRAAVVCLVLAVLTATQWTRSTDFDRLAAAAAAGLLTAALIWSIRNAIWKRALGVLAWCALLACVAAYARAKNVPGLTGLPLEVLILAGLGIACGGASLTLGILTTSNADRHAATGLLAACLVALTWSAAGMDGLSGAGALLKADTAVFIGAGGGWRWGGLLAVWGAWLLLKPKPEVKKIEPPKVKNWNK